MKKWQLAIIAVALLGAVAGLGASWVAATAPQPRAGTVTLPPATVVVANPNWTVPQSFSRPATLPLAPALPAATGSVLFSADFSSSDAAAWHSPLLPESDMAPLWLVQNGTVQQAGDVNGEGRLEETYYLTGQSSWSNYVYEASMLATSGEGSGLVWNVQGDRFLRVQLLPANPPSTPSAQLELVQGTQSTTLAETDTSAYAGYPPYVWQTLRIQSSGDHQQVWVNGTLLFDVHNGTLTSGQVGLYAWADSGARFDNVRVQTAPPSR